MIARDYSPVEYTTVRTSLWLELDLELLLSSKRWRNNKDITWADITPEVRTLHLD